MGNSVLAADEEANKAEVDGEALKLTAAEWEILLFLSSNGGAVVTRERILERCLEYSSEGCDRTVDTHIKNLRAKLGRPGWIETIRGYGCRFAGESLQRSRIFMKNPRDRNLTNPSDLIPARVLDAPFSEKSTIAGFDLPFILLHSYDLREYFKKNNQPLDTYRGRDIIMQSQTVVA